MKTTTSLSPRAVADAAGVSTDTLRHYERLGLLPPPARTRAGYRRYTPATVPRVQLIQRALVIGFSLQELGQVLQERDRGGAPCRTVRKLVGQRSSDLEQRLRELTVLRHELRALLAEWDDRLAGTPEGKPARLLESLGQRTIVEDARRRRQRVRLRAGRP